MKCPNCTTPISELRDVCPACISDLRSFKQSSGLPVSYPKLTFRALLDKYGLKASLPPELDQKIEVAETPQISQIAHEFQFLESPASSLKGLFVEARKDLSKLSSSTELDMSTAVVLSTRERERALILLQLAREEIAGVKHTRVEKLRTSADVTIENTEVTARLRELESAVLSASTPLAKLKDLAPTGRVGQSGQNQPVERLTNQIESATRSRRIIAYLSDLVGASILFSIVFAIYDGINDLGAVDALISQSYEMINLAAVLPILYWMVPSALWGYFVLSYLSMGGTFGELFTSLDVSSHKRGRIGLGRLLFRALLLPTNLLLITSVPILFARRGLVDWLAGTRLVRSQTYGVD